MNRSLAASALLHGVVIVAVIILSLRGPESPDLPPVYQVNLVQAAETRPEKVETEPMEIPPEEPEAEEEIPDPDATPPEPDRESPAPEAIERGPDLPVTLEGQPFEFPWYLEALVRKVQRNWRPGEGALKATVYFRIDRSGNITETRIETSSGSFLFDRAAQRAVDASDPMPPLPAEYAGDHLGVYFDFDTGVALAE